MRLLGEAMYITWRGMGVIIDNFIETEENVSIYISVPKSSYRKNVTGIEMSGEFLAKRFKESLTEMGIKKLTVAFKIRNENWTKEKEEEATLKARKEIFGSQY